MNVNECMSYEYSDTQNILSSLARSHQSEEKFALKIAAENATRFFDFHRVTDNFDPSLNFPNI